MENMYDKKAIAVLGQILLKLNLGQRTITLGEIARVSESDSQSGIFSWDKPYIQGVLKKLEKQNFVVETEKDVFNITVDIASFREFILSVSGHSIPHEEDNGTSIALEEILEKEWSLKEADESEDGDDDASFTDRRAYLFARRRELMRMMEQEAEDNDDDEDDEDDEDEEVEVEEVEESQDEDIDHTFDMISALKNGLDISIEQSANGKESYIFSVDGLKLGNQYVEFEMYANGDKHYITDKGVTGLVLGESPKLNAEGLEDAVEKIIDHYGLITVETELRIEVSNPEEAVACLMRLYAAMEAICNIDEEAISICVARDKSNARCREIITRLAQKDRKIDRSQAIMRIRAKLDEAQSIGDFDSVYEYVYAISVLAALEDEDFEDFRKYVLEVEESDVDPLYIKALAVVVKLGRVSISLIQRKCQIGYSHAGKIVEWMENMGYISDFDSKTRTRTILITKEEFEAKYGPLD